MTITYLDRVLYIYPDIQHVMYWHAQYDGTPWEDPYDGLVWENKEVPKPSKQTLDALDENTVKAELLRRQEVVRKNYRDADARKNITIMAAFHAAEQSNPDLTLRDYLDSLEQLARDAK